MINNESTSNAVLPISQQARISFGIWMQIGQFSIFNIFGELGLHSKFYHIIVCKPK